jgi:hypothetical protein
MRTLIGFVMFAVLSLGIILQGSGAMHVRLPLFEPDAAPSEAPVDAPSEASAPAASGADAHK